MKKIAITFLLATLIILSFAQTPQAFKYNAVVRNISGDILANQNASFQISILHGSTTGTAVYVEAHDTITNEFGLVNLEIGNGSLVSGVFADIDWGEDNYFLQVEMDKTGNTNYQIMGTSQLLSVPYAMYSAATGDGTRWLKNEDDLFYTSGHIGIGTSQPSESSILELEVLLKGFYHREYLMLKM